MDPLTDGVVTLVRWRQEDLDVLVRTVSGSLEHLGGWLGWATGGYGEADAKEFLRAQETGESRDYAIRGPGGVVVGGCGLMDRDPGREIGYWLAKEHTGRGYVTRAAALLVAESWREGATFVDIKHDERNERSGAVPRRLGFIHHGEELADPVAPECSGFTHVWRMTRPEWIG
ncbi:GNAT family N-acetyltransferase [Amycolatopsis jiangsuensis]|uniref:RimJ/RimL family protein N-acetyltransferase n=1 Tax=Amycolatopsis jiangsuensis TaxID=1181879 RepID=A0A840IT51_9PSEU|nr:GNAT family N-acetyltransferase [Amycolatopsis jiangsuensis]MBB4684547.1 RimJ/RimL family protein N-acetyltransferase [Amycolatopsis jiangsuensis]